MSRMDRDSLILDMNESRELREALLRPATEMLRVRDAFFEQIDRMNILQEEAGSVYIELPACRELNDVWLRDTKEEQPNSICTISKGLCVNTMLNSEMVELFHKEDRTYHLPKERVEKYYEAKSMKNITVAA